MDKFSAGQLRDLAELIWGKDLPTPPDNQVAEYTMWQIAEGLRNSATRREWEKKRSTPAADTREARPLKD